MGKWAWELISTHQVCWFGCIKLAVYIFKWQSITAAVRTREKAMNTHFRESSSFPFLFFAFSPFYAIYFFNFNYLWSKSCMLMLMDLYALLNRSKSRTIIACMRMQHAHHRGGTSVIERDILELLFIRRTMTNISTSRNTSRALFLWLRIKAVVILFLFFFERISKVREWVRGESKMVGWCT